MPLPPEFRSDRITGSEDDLRERLYEMRATDGLPIVLPTPARVAQMIEMAAMAGYDPDLVFGEIGPNMGQASVEKIAINAVMAGCLPEHFPIVIAAIQALCDPVIDTTEFQVTTHQVAPLLIVHGPAAQIAGIASGTGALGYGHRANLSIGRAVRLCLINLGGVWPGTSAMAILGQPGSIAYCLAEAEDESPFPPLHTTLGFPAETSAVTVACLGVPVSVLAPPSSNGSPLADRLLALLASAIADPANNNASGISGTILVILNPDHAHALHAEGYGRDEIKTELLRRAGQPAKLISWLRGSAPPANPEAFVPAIGGADKLLIMVAGGPGIYSTIMTSWGGGPHGNMHVTREIIFSDMCEVDLAQG